MDKLQTHEECSQLVFLLVQILTPSLKSCLTLHSNVPAWSWPRKALPFLSSGGSVVLLVFVLFFFSLFFLFSYVKTPTERAQSACWKWIKDLSEKYE